MISAALKSRMGGTACLFILALLNCCVLPGCGSSTENNSIVGVWSKASDQVGEEGGLIRVTFAADTSYSIVYTKGALGDKPEFVGTYTVTGDALSVTSTDQKTEGSSPTTDAYTFTIQGEKKLLIYAEGDESARIYERES